MATTAASNTISGQIKWTGLASDTDFGSVVTALINTERRVITKQETWKSQWQEKLEKINNLDTRLSALKTGADSYRTRDKLLSRKATSSDEKVATVTNTSTAATGSYTVEVADKTVDIKSSRTYKSGEPIGINYTTNDKGDPVDADGNVLGVTSWNVDGALALLSTKLPTGTDFPLSFDQKTNNFLDANGDVVAKRDPATNKVLNTNDVALFELQRNSWISETTLTTLASKLTNPALPLSYNENTGNFSDKDGVVVAKMNMSTSEIYEADPPNTVLFQLGADGISTTWETDSALMILSQRFSNKLPLTFDPDTNEFKNSDDDVVAMLDPKTKKVYDPDPTKDDVFFTMSSHTMTNWDDPNIIKFLEEHEVISENIDRPFSFDPINNVYYSGGITIAELDPLTGEIRLPDASAELLLKVNDKGQVVNPDDGYPIVTSDTDKYLQGPMTFTMNGKTMSLKYDPKYDPETDGIVAGKFSDKCTMEQLCDIINATAQESGYTGPDIKAEIIFDKTRQEKITNADGDEETVTVTYNRLRIIGGEAGSENTIEIFDPTDLCMDRNSIDAPNLTQWIGSEAKPALGTDSEYTGHVNKTITFVISEGGVLGTDTIKISWADTENKAGTFTIEPGDWDSATGKLKKDIEVTQGVTINFDGGASGNRLMQNNAFSLDCQAPSVQKAADSGMAQSDKWVHKGFPDLTSPVVNGAGKFDFSYAGMEYSIPVKDGTTLSALADTINSSNKNPGVIASVLNDGMGTATSYKLVLTGAHSGSEHEIRILPTSSLNKLDCSPESFDHARTATNSMCRVDGYPSDGVSWIQRQSNEVADVLNGAVLQLQGVGETTINIVNDVTAMADKIKQIVEAVNYAMSYIQEQTSYGGGKLTIDVLKDGTIERKTEGGDASGVMIGNYGFQISNSEIKSIMSSTIFSQADYIKAIDPDGKGGQANLPKDEQKKLYETYLEENGLLYTRLSDIGIAFDAKASTDAKNKDKGAYVIEESKLNEALRKNPEAVIKLFTFRPDEEFNTYTKYEDEDPRPTLTGGICQKLYYSMSDLTRSSDVYDKKTGEMVQSAKGIMRVLSENYSNIISGIDAKIAREEKRITLKQTSLEEKFNRLEVMLAKLNQQSTSLKAQLDKLDS
ncbi:hypothetical protein C4J81_04045 [Deltaproteobacteria bacterium Smac51]|nr:hypothetical protein C4J81_04045 [Deltaproteobacteria bacterium Smac51]